MQARSGPQDFPNRSVRGAPYWAYRESSCSRSHTLSGWHKQSKSVDLLLEIKRSSTSTIVANVVSETCTGYLKAVWPVFGGTFLRSGRGTGKLSKLWGAKHPSLSEGFPGPRHRPDLKSAAKQIWTDCIQLASCIHHSRPTLSRTRI